jgi:hypothetical protein
VGADSVSLGASGLAFGVLGASASFGWRRGVRGRLRNHFGVRLLPWLFALFAVGLGSSGVDNWGHAGGLAVGLVMGFFMEPRPAAGEGPSRRLAAAFGAAASALAIGAVAAPFLPLLGSPRSGPSDVQIRVPIGWRRAGEGPDRISFTNGLSAGFRSTATVWVGSSERGASCRGSSCGCGDVQDLVRGLVEADLFRLLDSGPLVRIDLAEKPVRARVGAHPAAHIEGIVTTADGAARLSAVCALSPSMGGVPVAVVALEPADEPGKLAQRIAEAIELPAGPPAEPRASASQSVRVPSVALSARP